MIKIMSIAGARPNFMKLASIVRAIESHNQRLEEETPDKDDTTTGRRQSIKHIIVHTGQHYDARMSHSFFEDLGIPKPDINLEVGSGSHAAQTAEIMKRFEPVLLQEQPDVLLVVGDVNSTIACTLVASKIQYPESSNNRSGRARPLIVHVEAGLRSFDRDMPEEINRILTDAISDLLFVTEESGRTNLLQEGVPENKIHFVGNVMIDTLKQHLERADSSDIRKRLDLPPPMFWSRCIAHPMLTAGKHWNRSSGVLSRLPSRNISFFLYIRGQGTAWNHMVSISVSKKIKILRWQSPLDILIF
ncbi:hypothetical protein GF1_00420 [Desulfolithobacter dissulfuricans]|uniref:UDP-N-acetylglucosamine 2-epimerase domain-containing protein n=1 Tax=Desulfolithobacter dissulfuricans TaxID=2795293 RepID=A0A915TXP8_9BACT|nr:hypothetical protein GF1_00420 [Desulfolithobacter dissulfuricans]